METSVRKSLRAFLLLVLAVGMLAEKSNGGTFRDCYTKCFIFCMIDPSQTICKCTTKCLKDCIFQDIITSSSVHGDDHHQDDHSENLGYCKLGCAFSMCSDISTKTKPNGDKVDGCVGSCSKKCTRSY